MAVASVKRLRAPHDQCACNEKLAGSVQNRRRSEPVIFASEKAPSLELN